MLNRPSCWVLASSIMGVGGGCGEGREEEEGGGVEGGELGCVTRFTAR